MIKNIVFDLGNVILKDKMSSILKFTQISNEEKEAIENNFFKNWTELDLGNISVEEHLNNCKINLREELREILLNYYRYRQFNKEIIDLMHKLKENHYRIYILSNNNKETVNYLKELSIFKCIDGWIVSCDYNVMKPNKEIYEILFRKYDLNPKECFFIDDSKENIEASKRLGMNGHILNFKEEGIEKLLKDMRKNKIKC